MNFLVYVLCAGLMTSCVSVRIAKDTNQMEETQVLSNDTASL